MCYCTHKAGRALARKGLPQNTCSIFIAAWDGMMAGYRYALMIASAWAFRRVISAHAALLQLAILHARAKLPTPALSFTIGTDYLLFRFASSGQGAFAGHFRFILLLIIYILASPFASRLFPLFRWWCDGAKTRRATFGLMMIFLRRPLAFDYGLLYSWCASYGGQCTIRFWLSMSGIYFNIAMMSFRSRRIDMLENSHAISIACGFMPRATGLYWSYFGGDAIRHDARYVWFDIAAIICIVFPGRLPSPSPPNSFSI